MLTKYVAVVRADAESRGYGEVGYPGIVDYLLHQTLAALPIAQPFPHERMEYCAASIERLDVVLVLHGTYCVVSFID